MLTRHAPRGTPPGSVQFVTDVAECAALARAAVGDGAVSVLGAGAAQALLAAGELDDLELHVVPVLLGRGRRLFDHLGPEHVELELVRQVRTRNLSDPAQHVLHLRYRVRRRSRREARAGCPAGCPQALHPADVDVRSG